MKKMNNKGFSLVELIVVIAIMVVLVAVLAPVFTKYVEQSRRSTDVSNAQSIAESVLADVADGKSSGSSALFTEDSDVTVTAGIPTAIQSTPAPKARGAADEFTFHYDSATNVCHVYADSSKALDLTDSTAAQTYKEFGPAGE